MVNNSQEASSAFLMVETEIPTSFGLRRQADYTYCT